jgi:hypothetical protein
MANDKQETVPYQFEVPVDLHAAVMDKSKQYGVALAPFMRMAFEQFLDREVSVSLDKLQEHNKKRKRGR